MSRFAKRFTKAVSAAMLALSLVLCGTAAIGAVTPTPAWAKTSKAIGKSKATKIALKDAGLKKRQVKGLSVESGSEKGHKVYEVEFRRGTRKYEYDIDKYTGEIVDKDLDRVKSSKSTGSKKAVGKSKAIKIALKKAGFTKAQVKGLKVTSDWESGHKVYEVEFQRGKYEYEYDVDKYTGKIISKDKDRIG